MSTNYIIWKARRSPVITKHLYQPLQRVMICLPTNKEKSGDENVGGEGRLKEEQSRQLAQLEKNKRIEQSVSLCERQQSMPVRITIHTFHPIRELTICANS